AVGSRGAVPRGQLCCGIHGRSGRTAMPDKRPATILIAEGGAAPGGSPLAATLRRAGWRVWAARDAREAQALAAERPDLILLDVRLPDGSGIDLCRNLKAVPATADTPVVLMYPATSTSGQRPDPKV